MARSRITSLLLRAAFALLIVHAGREFRRSTAFADAPADSSARPDSGGAAKPDVRTASADGSDSSAAAPAKSPPKAERKGNAALGKKIFSVKCVACHKPDGSGGVKITGNPTPNWRDAKRMNDPKHDDAYLRECITNGRPKSGMPVWSKQGVKPGDIDNLIAYIRTFSAPKK